MDEKEGISQLIEMVAKLRTTMIDKFDDIEEKLLEHDNKFEQVDKRFDKIEEKLSEHDDKFEHLDQRFDEHDNRFDRIDKKLGIIHENQTKIARVIRVMQHYIENNQKHIDKIKNKDKYFQIQDLDEE